MKYRNAAACRPYHGPTYRRFILWKNTRQLGQASEPLIRAAPEAARPGHRRRSSASGCRGPYGWGRKGGCPGGPTRPPVSPRFPPRRPGDAGPGPPGSVGRRGCIGFTKSQLTLVQPQGENPVPLWAGRSTSLLRGRPSLSPVKFQSRLVIGNDDCHVMNTIQLHNKNTSPKSRCRTGEGRKYILQPPPGPGQRPPTPAHPGKSSDRSLPGRLPPWPGTGRPKSSTCGLIKARNPLWIGTVTRFTAVGIDKFIGF